MTLNPVEKKKKAELMKSLKFRTIVALSFYYEDMFSNVTDQLLEEFGVEHSGSAFDCIEIDIGDDNMIFVTKEEVGCGGV